MSQCCQMPDKKNKTKKNKFIKLYNIYEDIVYASIQTCRQGKIREMKESGNTVLLCMYVCVYRHFIFMLMPYTQCKPSIYLYT